MLSAPLLLSLVLIACQSEPVEGPVAGPGGAPVGPPPEGGGAGPGGGGPDRDAPVRATLQGNLVLEDFAGGMLQVDVVGQKDGAPQVLGMERYDQPGPFRLAVRGDYDSVDLIVYIDTEGDGPSAGDLRVAYAGNPISLTDKEIVDGLEVDLANAEAQDGAPKEGGPDGEGTPSEAGGPPPGADAPGPPPAGSPAGPPPGEGAPTDGAPVEGAPGQ